MQLITEINQDNSRIVEERDGAKKKYYIEGVFLQAEIENGNRRKYPKEVLGEEVRRYTNEKISQNRAYGELGHPEGPSINLERAVILTKELKEDNNNWIGKARVLESAPLGNVVVNLIQEGAGFGVSSRGLGSLKRGSDGVAVVQNDFYLATAADIVADPSAPAAFVNGIYEGMEWVWDDKGDLVQRIQQQVEEEIRKNKFDKKAQEAAFLKAFDNYVKSF